MNNANWLPVSLLIVGALAAPAFAAGLQNGGFEDPIDPLNFWQAKGNVAIIATTSGNQVARFQEVTSGGLSRIYQVFDLAPQPTFLFFKYKLLHYPAPNPAEIVPPDSFTAFLLDNQGNRLVIPAGGDPDFAKGFLYQDTNGMLVYSPVYVTVGPPDNEGFCTVTLDISTLTGGAPARVEFGLANADNGVTSTLFVDGIQAGCVGDLHECPDLDIVFVMDSSGSMNSEGQALCLNITTIVANLEASLGVNVNASLLGIDEAPGGIFDCLTDTVLNLYGPDVPGLPGGCPGNLGSPPSTGQDELSENWGFAIAAVAENRAWTSSLRLIIPITDEGPCRGGSTGCQDSFCSGGGGTACSDEDTAVVDNAIALAQANDVIVSTITASGTPSCVITAPANAPDRGYATRLADATDGVTFQSTNPAADLQGFIEAAVQAACDQVCGGGAPLVLKDPTSTSKLTGPIATVDRTKNTKEGE